MNSYLTFIQSFTILTLVVLQEHAHALPQPWPIVIDGLLEVADSPHWIEQRRPRGLPVKVVQEGVEQLSDKKDDKKSDQPAPQAKGPEPPEAPKKPDPPTPASPAKGDQPGGENHGGGGGSSKDPGGFSSGAIAGVVVGAVLLAVGVYFIYRCWCKKEDPEDEEEEK